MEVQLGSSTYARFYARVAKQANINTDAADEVDAVKMPMLTMWMQSQIPCLSFRDGNTSLS